MVIRKGRNKRGVHMNINVVSWNMQGWKFNMIFH